MADKGKAAKVQPTPSTSGETAKKNTESTQVQNAAASNDNATAKKEDKEEWKVQGISEIKASLVYVKNRLDYIKEEFYDEPPPSKSKQKKNAAASHRTKDGDVPTLVNSGFREMQIAEDGTARRTYGPRPNPNKNNFGEVIEMAKEEATEEDGDVKVEQKKKKKKKRKTKYAKRRRLADRQQQQQQQEDGIDSLSDSIITRLEYLGSTRDLLPGEQLSSDSEHYEIRQLESTGDFALITGDAVYGIGSPVIDSPRKGLRPLKLPIINVNAGFGKLKKDLQNGGNRSFETVILPTLQREHSFNSVKKSLQNVLRRNDRDGDGSGESARASSDGSGSTSFGNSARLGLSSKDGYSPGNYPSELETDAFCAGRTSDVTGSLRIAAIRPPGSLPALTKAAAEPETDVTLFGQVNWPHTLHKKAAMAHHSHLTPICSEPPPTTPESNLSDSELDKSQDVMSVTFRNQLFRATDRATGQRVQYRHRVDAECNGYRNEPDFSDLRLDIVHRPIRDKYQVK